ncbi:MAG: MBL fold metallo-hydrolase, partial [Alphaproteobacteria bacterium]|nr:MBL fold metallo-hydrolase [Alphaproteobacteria bacterium]
MNSVELAALDALDLLVVVDNESDTLSSVDKGVPQLPELGRLVARVPHLAPKDGHDCVEPWGHLCLACHGFSALVTGRRGSEERSVLFDVGPSAEVWLENARRLGVRLASIEAVCLSHWHADHSGGLQGGGRHHSAAPRRRAPAADRRSTPRPARPAWHQDPCSDAGAVEPVA